MNVDALKGHKILVTGPAGQIAQPICEALARDNEVWGIARFSQPGSRERMDALGLVTRQIELGSGDFGDLPTDFTYLLHLAAFIGPGLDYDEAIRVNAEGTGLLLTHCRKARAALIMTTASVYKPHEDPLHAYRETDPLGDSNLPSSPTYSMSKIGEEAVARTLARQLDLPIVIARMNSAYGDNGGLPGFQLDDIMADRPVKVRHDPNIYSPIHERDIIDQLPAILSAASVPATILNWAGDEMVSAQQWCALMGDLVGKTPKLEVVEAPGSHRGVGCDVGRRQALTGPCKVDWRDGIRDMVAARYPEALKAGV